MSCDHPIEEPTYADNSNYHLSKSKHLPKWLIEFNSYVNDEERKTTLLTEGSKQSIRPLTENPQHNRPKWFEDLSQKRRMSEIVNGNITKFNNNIKNPLDDNTLAGSSNSSLNSSIYQLNYQHPNDNHPIINNEDDDNDNGRKSKVDYTQFAFTLNDFDKLNVSRNSSSNGSKSSSILNDSIEEDIFTFGITKSIDSFKLRDTLLATMDNNEEFIIPEMPSGDELVLTLLENWGDESFIGLNGIEIIDTNGHKPIIKKIYMQDVGKSNLPVTDLHKLVDRINRTHDDAHIWQYRLPKRSTLPLRIIIQFEKMVNIALLRIWNHNKSRIHSYRGVRHLQISLNGHLIFKGEIARASGDLIGSVENFGDTILFTTNETILEAISHHDVSFQELLLEQIKMGML